MKLLSFMLWSAASLATDAFTVLPQIKACDRSSVKLSATNKAESDSWQNQIGRLLATGLVTASLWAAPAIVQDSFVGVNAPEFMTSSVANAKQMASASGSRVNKDPESLLRYGLPINSKEVGRLTQFRRWTFS